MGGVGVTAGVGASVLASVVSSTLDIVIFRVDLAVMSTNDRLPLHWRLEFTSKYAEVVVKDVVDIHDPADVNTSCMKRP